jgi:hypothetical protein
VTALPPSGDAGGHGTRRPPPSALRAPAHSALLPRPEPVDRGFPWSLIAAALFGVVMVALGALWVTNPARWEVGSGLLVVPLLTLATIPFFVRASRDDKSFDVAGLMAIGLFVRFLAVLNRYDYRQDGGKYHLYGVELAEQFRNFQFGADPGAPMPGTGGMRYLTGLVEVLTNNNEFATFLVFTWLGFVGCYLFYQAFVTAMPEGDHRRYALLVFLWPTLIFWPSSIGKDCWIVFSIGMASLGAARVIVRRRGGYTLLVVGSLLASLVRPHIALIAVVGFGVALLIGRRVRGSSRALTPVSVAKVAGLVLVLAVGAGLSSRVSEFLDANDIDSVDSAIATNVDRTTQGGSSFEPADPQNPLGYARAAVTILFRPFPQEASGYDGMGTAFEALFLAGLAVASWRRLATIPFRLRRDPYVAYALSVVLMLIFALGTIGNFGILSRQRSQIVPFVFVLLSLTVAKTDEEPASASPPSRTR